MAKPDDLFGDELSLADDVSPEDSLDQGLESERLGPAGPLSPDEQATIDAYHDLVASKGDDVMAYEADKGTDKPAEDDSDDEEAPAEPDMEEDSAPPGTSY